MPITMTALIVSTEAPYCELKLFARRLVPTPVLSLLPLLHYMFHGCFVVRIGYWHWLQYCSIVAEHSAHLGLNSHRWKSKILKVNSNSTVSVTLVVQAIYKKLTISRITAPLTRRVEPKQTLKPGSVRQGWPFFKWRIFGNPTSFSRKTRSGFSIQMSRLFFFTEQRHGGPQLPQQRGYRPLSTAA